jgi:hypothetical protein
MIHCLLCLLSKDGETCVWTELAKEVKDFKTFDEAVTCFRQKALHEDHHHLGISRNKSKARVIHKMEVEPSPSQDAATMMSAFMTTFNVQAMLQQSWPDDLKHLRLSKDIFNCIPSEARLQFIKNCNELTQKLMNKDSSSSSSIKGEKGESSAQSNTPSLTSKPFKSRSQSGNLALKNAEETDQEDEVEDDEESNDTTADIQAAFGFLQESHRNQHGCMTRIQALEAPECPTLEINGHTLVQVRNLMSDKADVGLTCVDGCANAGVISACTHHIKDMVVG